MRGRRTWSLALWAALGCGGAAPRPTPTLAGATVHYAPLAMRDDARRPTQAVVLGTDEADGSTVLALPAVARAVTVDAPVGRELVAIALSAAPGPSAAITGALPASDGAARWNAGLWSAALAAADALGKDLPDLAWSATPARAAEQIAASALIAAGWLASATGEAVDPAATVLGVLGPDGSILPAPDLAGQLLAAVSHGKTRVGVPAGAHELIAQARAHHAEAIELATVHDAYQLLTHKRLPAAVPVGEADMALDAETARALDALYLGWQRRLASEWAALLRLEQAGRQPPAIAALDKRAHARGEQAEALHRAGRAAAAYAGVVDAWVCAAAANQARGVVRAVTSGKLDEALAQLRAATPDEPSLAGVIDKLGALRPSSVIGHLAMVDGFQTALRGWGDQRAAEAALTAAQALLTDLRVELGAPATADAAAAAIAPAIELRLRAVSQAAVADEQLALAPDQGAAALPPSLSRLAPALTAAATAQLGDVDAAIVDPATPGAAPHTARDVARRRLATIEPELPIAVALAGTLDL
ncbi:MAG TPA: hypothetical protein VGC42_23100, partial [Kofleriaceae bacterium]